MSSAQAKMTWRRAPLEVACRSYKTGSYLTYHVSPLS